MRQFSRWVAFICFWSIFTISLISIITNIIFTQNYSNFIFVSECFIIAASLVLFIVTTTSKLVISSPKLGRKIIHDTGTYYVDYTIERYVSEIRTNVFIYKDKILWKKVLSNSVVFNPNDDGDLVKEINKCLVGIQKEHDAKKDIKSLKTKDLNLLSIEAKRDSKVKSIFG
jgi:hypothetical protein